ncbi:MAG: aldehyde dehydrogenase family protein [Candidatus Heimdallarchaeaceae archaeon]|jgi:acyl-CoA reductase-like NAD-dependent aldehyde dehydrogenase
MATSSIDALPLLRNGEEYLSQSKKTLIGIHGERLLDVAVAPEIHVQMALPINKGAGFNLLQNMAIDDIIDIYVEAGKIFMQDMLINNVSTSLDEFSELITLSTGMPITYVNNALNIIPQIFKKRPLQRILRASSPTGSLTIYDEFVDVRGNTRFAWAPKGKNCGVALPGNHPAVSLLGALIPLFKIPAILRASSTEPFTSFRLCKSLWEAGLPAESLFHFVTDHSVVDTIVRKSDMGVIFGNEWILKAYENNTHIKTYGPGRSKILVDIENMSPSLLDLSLDIAHQSISLDGGRGCINCSGVVFKHDDGYEEFRDKLAEKLASVETLDPMDPKAEIPAMQTDPARGLYKFIKSRMDSDVKNVTASFRGTEEFLEVNDNLAYLLPTLLEVGEDSQIRTDEYPFAFGTIVKADDYFAEELMEDSLSVGYLTDDPSKARNLLRDPTIKKVFVNDQTFLMDVAQPHEGFQGDFLYRSKATNYDGLNNILK